MTSLRGRRFVGVTTAVLAVGLAAGCSSGSTHGVGTPPASAAATSHAAPNSPAAPTSSPRPTPTVTAGSADADGHVPFGHPVTLHVDGGAATTLTAHDADGQAVPGRWNDAHDTWTSRAPIPSGSTWSWTAKGPAGSSAEGTVEATTATRTVRATANIGSHRTVGIAAPIVVKFAAKVTDKAYVERHLKVLMRPEGSKARWKPATGSWAWLPDNAPNSTVHFRTKHYWPAHTQVRVRLPLADLDWGGGVTGVQNLDWTFTIGRSQIVKADARTHHIVIYRAGKKVATYPASYGLDSQLNRNTRSGISIVTEKYKNIRMKSELFDYDLMEHWAVRINNNGEFIHANPETVRFQGKTNVSHGCINLSTPDAKAYFKTAIYGDPVEVTGTRTKLSDSRTELYDWALSWKQWKKLSALT